MNALDKQLFIAVLRGSTNDIIPLLSNGANMNTIDKNGRTCLCLAASLGYTDILEIFIEYSKTQEKCNTTQDYLCSRQNSNLGYFVFYHKEDNAFGDDAVTPDDMDKLEWDTEMDSCPTEDEEDTMYHWYAEWLSKTSELLPQDSDSCINANINKEDKYGYSPLHYAALEGHTDAVRLLLDAGCNVNVADTNNTTPLHLAALKDAPEILKILIHAGAKVNSRTCSEETPLHSSVLRGYIENVKILVSSGADLEALDATDKTPVHIAVAFGHTKIASYLIQVGAKVNTEDCAGNTPLNEAVYHCDATIVKQLLDARAKITQSHEMLHYAVEKRQPEIVELLVNSGVVINLRDTQGYTPLLLACMKNQYDTANILLKNGASVNFANSVTGNTPLHEIVEHWQTDELFDTMFHILQKYEVNLDIESEAGYTPLYLALMHNKYHAAEMLIKHGADVNRPIRPCIPNVFSCLLRRYNIFSFLSHRNNFRLIKLLIYAGYKFDDRVPIKGNSSILDSWVHDITTNPMRLVDLCRIKIRHCLKNKIHQKLSKSKLPFSIINFLMLEDVSNDF